LAVTVSTLISGANTAHWSGYLVWST